MIRSAAGVGPLLPRPDPCASPLRTRPACLPRQGVATAAARPTAPHLTVSRPDPTSLTVAGERADTCLRVSPRSGPCQGPRHRSQRRRADAARRGCPSLPRPRPLQRPPRRGPVGGVREPGRLATAKQGQVRTGVELAGGGRGRVGLPVSAPVAVALFRGPLASGGSLHRLSSCDVRLPPGGGR